MSDLTGPSLEGSGTPWPPPPPPSSTPAGPTPTQSPSLSPPTPSYPPSTGPQPWSPQAAPPRPAQVSFPPWLDIGMLIIGIGALLVFLGFLFGDWAAGQLGPGGSVSSYQGDLEAFFVLSAFGILLIVGGWLYRLALANRRALAMR